MCRCHVHYSGKLKLEAVIKALEMTVTLLSLLSLLLLTFIYKDAIRWQKTNNNK